MSKLEWTIAGYIVFWFLLIVLCVWALSSVNWAYEIGNFIKEVREASL